MKFRVETIKNGFLQFFLVGFVCLLFNVFPFYFNFADSLIYLSLDGLWGLVLPQYPPLYLLFWDSMKIFGSKFLNVGIYTQLCIYAGSVYVLARCLVRSALFQWLIICLVFSNALLWLVNQGVFSESFWVSFVILQFSFAYVGVFNKRPVLTGLSFFFLYLHLLTRYAGVVFLLMVPLNRFVRDYLVSGSDEGGDGNRLKNILIALVIGGWGYGMATVTTKSLTTVYYGVSPNILGRMLIYRVANDRQFFSETKIQYIREKMLMKTADNPLLYYLVPILDDLTNPWRFPWNNIRQAIVQAYYKKEPLSVYNKLVKDYQIDKSDYLGLSETFELITDQCFTDLGVTYLMLGDKDVYKQILFDFINYHRYDLKDDLLDMVLNSDNSIQYYTKPGIHKPSVWLWTINRLQRQKQFNGKPMVLDVMTWVYNGLLVIAFLLVINRLWMDLRATRKKSGRCVGWSYLGYLGLLIVVCMQLWIHCPYFWLWDYSYYAGIALFLPALLIVSLGLHKGFFMLQNYRPLVPLFLFEAYLFSITIVNAHQVRLKIGGYLLTTLFIVTVLANTARTRKRLVP